MAHRLDIEFPSTVNFETIFIKNIYLIPKDFQDGHVEYRKLIKQVRFRFLLGLSV